MLDACIHAFGENGFLQKGEFQLLLIYETFLQEFTSLDVLPSFSKSSSAFLAMYKSMYRF